MTTQQKPLALHLADFLGSGAPPLWALHDGAAELRRLYEVNAELVEALKRMKLEKGFVCECGIEEVTWDLIESAQEKINDSR